MTTIRELKADYKQAMELDRAGKILDGARLALSVQRLAARSRSRHAATLAMDAHCWAATGLYRGRLTRADQPTLSELGRVKAESEFLLHGRSA